MKIEHNKEEITTKNKTKEEISIFTRITAIGVGILILIGSIFVIKKHAGNSSGQFYDANGKRIGSTLGKDGIFTYSYKVEDNTGIKKFMTPLVYFLIDKETNEIGTYIYYTEGHFRLYDLNTEELIAYEYTPDLFDNGIANYDYYHHLVNDFNWIPLTDAPRYITGIKLKDHYSKDEINEIRDQILTAVIKEETNSK